MSTRLGKSIRFVFRFIFILSVLSAPLGMVDASESASVPPALTQFTSGGHVLGFTAGGMYAATLSHALHVEFVGANLVQPQTSVRPLDLVTYADLWRGVSLTYSTGLGGIYTTSYTVAPGADVSDIRLLYDASLSLNEDGTLGVSLPTTTLTESAPIAWQQITGQRVPVPVAFRLQGQQVSFAVGAYDGRYALTIDPTLVVNTFIGGIGVEWGEAIAVDANHNVYVTGGSEGGFGSTVIRAYTAYFDAFVVKLGPTGPVWTTYLGGNKDDWGRAIGVDPDGNIYVAGDSGVSGEGGAAWGCEPAVDCTVRDYSGGIDAFYARLDPDGNLVWNTFLGGSSNDLARAETGGQSGLYVVGQTESAWGCVYSTDIYCTGTVRSYTPPGASASDGFVVRLDHDGNLIWNTFLGGTDADAVNAITLRADQSYPNIYVAGESMAAWGCEPDPECTVRDYTSSGYDAFVAWLGADGDLAMNTFLGDVGDSDDAHDIAQDGYGNLYVSGTSNAAWGCDPDCTVRDFSGGHDGLAAKLDPNLILQWNTFLGGDAQDEASRIALDDAGNIYLAGWSDVAWGDPLRAFTTSYGSSDGFAVKLGPSGALAASMFLGGVANDFAADITLDAERNVYLVGTSAATWGNPLEDYHGMWDAFVATTDFALRIDSTAAHDGWILESSETSTIGGTKNGGATTLRLGDETGNRQYRAVLSFNTALVPAGVTIESATLEIKKGGRVGTNPFRILGGLKVDVRSGSFKDNPSLQLGDFRAAAHHSGVLTFTNTPVNNWFSASLANTEFEHINTAGFTQFRLRFVRGDNNDGGADYVKIYSGNAPAASRPLLIIVFTVP